MATILVVDDDQASCRLVAKYLHRAGHHVVARHDGQTGLDLALAQPPDLILLDMMMPRLDGLAVCMALRAAEATRDLPVIFLSASGDVNDPVAGLDRGATDYLVKPFAPEDLLARVRAALRAKQLQDALREANGQLHQLEQSRQEFVSMLAHDIRGLLGAVSRLWLRLPNLRRINHRQQRRHLLLTFRRKRLRSVTPTSQAAACLKRRTAARSPSPRSSTARTQLFTSTPTRQAPSSSTVAV